MKKITNYINLKYFDYRNYVGEKIYEKSLCTYFDNTMVIYVKEPAIKYYLNSIKNSILESAKEYKPNLEKIEIKEDKKSYIENRNKNKDNIILKEEYIKNKEGLERTLERAKKNIEDFNDDKLNDFFNISLKRLEENYDRNKIICKNCGYKFSPVSICPICFFYNIDNIRAKAESKILKNPFIPNENNNYIDARNKIYLDKKYSAMSYITDNFGKINKEKLIKILVEAVVYLSGSKDKLVIEMGVQKLKQEMREYGLKQGYKIDI